MLISRSSTPASLSEPLLAQQSCCSHNSIAAKDGCHTVGDAAAKGEGCAAASAGSGGSCDGDATATAAGSPAAPAAAAPAAASGDVTAAAFAAGGAAAGAATAPSAGSAAAAAAAAAAGVTAPAFAAGGAAAGAATALSAGSAGGMDAPAKKVSHTGTPLGTSSGNVGRLLTACLCRLASEVSGESVRAGQGGGIQPKGVHTLPAALDALGMVSPGGQPALVPVREAGQGSRV